MSDYLQIALIAIILLFIIVSFINRILRDKAGEDTILEATLVDKHSTTYEWHGRSGVNPKEINVLVFNAGGKIHKFEVSRLAWEYAGIGSVGTLSFHGERYIDFRIKRSSPTKNKKYRRIVKSKD